MSSRPAKSHRETIYYWKCDRPAAFHGTSGSHHHAPLAGQLRPLLEEHFAAPVELHPGHGQGNHITFTATVKGRPLFVRIDDGPEHDDYLEVESRIQTEVGALGIPTPQVHAVDASRGKVPFAWQVMDLISFPDLNQLHKQNQLDLPATARSIGAAIASWQNLQPCGFGPFNPAILQRDNRLEGFHSSYPDYFFQHFERHLAFLGKNAFLSPVQTSAINHEVLTHQRLLDLPKGCLVHKDLAFWNMLGNATKIAAFIDWDDAISGDPMDDISLLACFHDSTLVSPALEAYGHIRPLPADHRRRFWLHLLRNMLVKAVIRVGAGYFSRSDSFFLVQNGTDLKTFTLNRLTLALQGLREDWDLEKLGSH